MFDRFTDRARRIIDLADQEARRLNHNYVGTEHILLGLVGEGAGVGVNVLRKLGVSLRDVKLEIDKKVEKGLDRYIAPGRLPRTPDSERVIEYAIIEARELGSNYVGSEHFLLGLLREEGASSIAYRVLSDLGAEVDRVRRELV